MAFDLPRAAAEDVRVMATRAGIAGSDQRPLEDLLVELQKHPKLSAMERGWVQTCLTMGR